jgi:nucleoside-diphosphate-sugar epimerase
MKVLVTGANGFLGRRVITSLLAGPDAPARIVAADLTSGEFDDPRVVAKAGDVGDPEFISTIVEPDVDVVFHLAAVLSGQAEAEFDLGLRVNVEGTYYLLQKCRTLQKPARVVFSSTVAVFGGPLPEVVPETMAVWPQSSYGTAKSIGEYLINDFSRRGFIDGIAVRVPTVTVRPGKPNSAVSSFVSGIIREPVNGMESVCPVPLDTRLWICSPDAATANIVHAAHVRGDALGPWRTVNLPGLTVTPAEMLDSLERLAGPDARARVRVEIDDRIARLMTAWPGAFDLTRPLALGFTRDAHVDDIVRQYLRFAIPSR